MNEIEFARVINYLNDNGAISISTLGGKSNIHIGVLNSKIVITNSKGTQFSVNENFFNTVKSKILTLDLNDRMKGTSYTADNWKEGNPNTVFAPYVVSLYFYLIGYLNKEISNKEDFEGKFHFVKIGEFVLDKEKKPTRILNTDIRISDRLDLVYAFFIDGKCKYIGKSIQGYGRPVNYHKNLVMKTVNLGIIDALNKNLTIDILVRSKKVSIEFDGLKLNIIEPIEQALISLYNPEWNNLIQ